MGERYLVSEALESGRYVHRGGGAVTGEEWVRQLQTTHMRPEASQLLQAFSYGSVAIGKRDRRVLAAMQHVLTAGTGDQTCCCTTAFNVRATTEGDLRCPTAALVGSEGGASGLL